MAFNFNSFPISYFLDFSEILLTFFEFTEAFNKNIFYSWIFRGILVVSYYFKTELQDFLNGNEMKHFPPIFWNKIQYPLSFLLSTSNEEQQFDLIIVMQPFFEVEPMEIFQNQQKPCLHEYLHNFFHLTISHFQDFYSNSLKPIFFEHFLSAILSIEIEQGQFHHILNYTVSFIENIDKSFALFDALEKLEILTYISKVLDFSILTLSNEFIPDHLKLIDFISYFGCKFKPIDLLNIFESVLTFFVEYCQFHQLEWIPQIKYITQLEKIFQYHMQFSQRSFLISFRSFAQKFSFLFRFYI